MVLDVLNQDVGDTTEFTNVKVAEFGECGYLVGERKVFRPIKGEI